MTVAVSLAGRQFGRLTVLYRGENDRHGKSRWVCHCECGNEKLVNGNNLLKGTSQSCGCLHNELLASIRRTHGESNSPEMRVYYEARNRCTNLNSKNYKDYGARGIEFRFQSFEQFLSHIGKRPSSNHTLDRIDNSGHYEPGNVRWATMKEQCNNRRIRKDARIFKGQTKS